MKRGKKAQIELSFSMIFSILLIIAFVAVAFYAISYFLHLRNCTQEGMFVSDLQESVNSVWTASSKNADFSAPLPSNIKYVCFADFSRQANNLQEVYDELKIYKGEEARIYFYPTRKACNRYYKLQHVNITEITIQKNPYCVENTGKASFNLSKDKFEALVKIK